VLRSRLGLGIRVQIDSKLESGPFVPFFIVILSLYKRSERALESADDV